MALAIAALAPGAAAAGTLPDGYRDGIVFDGLTQPTAVQFAPDGRVFVAEKSGTILVYSGLDDAEPTVFANLRTKVHNFWDRGLLGLALDPNFPLSPYVYVAYTHDAVIGETAPRWGEPDDEYDPCPTPPGATANGCVVSGRVSRLEAAGDTMTGPEHVLVEDWCQQFPGHSIGDLAFGPEGALYVTGGDGANFFNPDYGQSGGNPCGDPENEGGALRSQDLRTPDSDPVGLDGTVIRINAATGEPWPGNPLTGSENKRRIVAYGLRNAFRVTFQPGTNDLWLGDVGWNSIEELDVLPVGSGAAVRNFGWPCYEGVDRQSGYDALNLPVCEGLYTSSGAVTPPHFFYEHGEPVIPEAGCVGGGSAMAGLAFYEGAAYPGYTGALFLADYSRNCIWTMLPDANGDPDPATRHLFERDAASPVDLELGPNGDLFYVAFGDGTPFTGSVRRITYRGPTAVATADWTSGPSPLQVQFDGTESTDANGGHAVTYAWYFDADDLVDSTAPRPTHTFTTRGHYTVRLKVTDTTGVSNTDSVVIDVGNGPPEAHIATPSVGTTWKVGDSIGFSGSGTDPDDGALPGSALSWLLVQHHCVTPGSCHTHSVMTVGGASGSFVAPDHDYPSHLELRLTVTDPQGLSDTDSILLYPQTVLLRFLSDPTGLELAVGSEAQSTPFERTVIVGSQNTVTAPSPQSLGGLDYFFSAWSDGGARSHSITAPTDATTYTAGFARPAQPQPPPPPAPTPPPPPPVPPAPPPAPVRPPQIVRCAAPRLIGQTLAGARRSLLRTHCRIGRVSWIYSRVPRGRVLTQNPRAGRRLPNLAKVAVVVSRGRKR